MKNFMAIIFLTCVATAGLNAAWRCKPSSSGRQSKVVYDDDQKNLAETVCGKGNVEHFEETAAEREKRHKERDERSSAAKAEPGLWADVRGLGITTEPLLICTGAGCSAKAKIN